MSARIFCKVGELRGLDAGIGDEAVLGRSRQATVPLRAELVSAEHARIRREPKEGRYVLEDLGSTNGTELDGMKVRGEELLGHLHVITLAGTYDLIFQDLDLCAKRRGDRSLGPRGEEPPSDDTEPEGLPIRLPGAIAADEQRPLGGRGGELQAEHTTVEPAPFALPSFLAAKADAARAAKTPVLGLEVEKPDGAERFRLAEGENLVGRVEDAAVRLDTLDVSRRHAVLTVAGGEVTVRDLGSSNRTWVDGVETSGAVPVRVGAKIAFGSLETRLVRWEGDKA
jgi:pSer/pThr/pTyr-binding forkhead associated (FHA) protein